MQQQSLNASSSLWNRASDLAWGGIDFQDMTFGGPECTYHVTAQRRILETAVGVAVAAFCLYKGAAGHAQRPDVRIQQRTKQNASMRTILLVLLSVVFGVEMGYKCVTRQLIIALFPCHMVTLAWIVLLAAPSISFFPASLRVNMYRVVVHFTHGTLLAIFFPVDDELHLPFEREVYWLQHYLILLVPLYMIRCESDDFPLPPYPANAEAIPVNCNWILISYGCWALYHFVVMQGAAFLSMANIGHMLCPSRADPFAGENYRMIGIAHQLFATVISAVLIALVRPAPPNPPNQEDVNRQRSNDSLNKQD